jgi:hypothetical protein
VQFRVDLLEDRGFPFVEKILACPSFIAYFWLNKRRALSPWKVRSIKLETQTKQKSREKSLSR